MTYYAEKAGKGYELICQGSDDGASWTELGKIAGKGLPGEAAKYNMHSDPNKQDEKGTLPVRIIELEIPMKQSGEYSHYRVVMRMAGAAYWTIHDMNFFNGGEYVELKPSSCFNSIWMSAGDAQEWIYVDLGTKSDSTR